MRKISFRFCVVAQYRFGFLERVIETQDGHQIVHLLSRKNGRWVKVAAEQVREQDIPSICLFLVDELSGVESKLRVGS